MNSHRFANTLRYLVIPFAIIALWSGWQPAHFPTWAFGLSLFLTFLLLSPQHYHQKHKREALVLGIANQSALATARFARVPSPLTPSRR